MSGYKSSKQADPASKECLIRGRYPRLVGHLVCETGHNTYQFDLDVRTRALSSVLRGFQHHGQDVVQSEDVWPSQDDSLMDPL